MQDVFGLICASIFQGGLGQEIKPQPSKVRRHKEL